MDPEQADMLSGDGCIPAMTVEEKIWLFGELSAEERRELELYVREHPEYSRLLDQSRAFWSVMTGGRILAEDPPVEEALAFFVVMRGVDEERSPRVLREAMDALEARIERDPLLNRRLEEMRLRRAEIEDSSKVEDQVRRLIGTVPGPTDHTRNRARGRQAPARSGDRESGEQNRPTWYATPPRSVARGAAALAAAYLILYLVGLASRPTEERLAAFDDSELVLEGYTDVRSGDGQGRIADDVEEYLVAIETLRQAERSFLGLFPRYDEERLEMATAAFRAVLAKEPEESFLADEARFMLAKTELAMGNVAEAKRLLSITARMGGRRSQDARVLLGKIHSL